MSKSYLIDRKDLFVKESARLEQQAAILFSHEMRDFTLHCKTAPKTILELGCGNGIFLQLLSKEFPDSLLFGIDRHVEFIKAAKKNCSTGNFFCLDINDSFKLHELLSENNPDLLILRYVLQHMSSSAISEFLDLLKNTRSRDRRIFVIDTNDELLAFEPKCDALIELSKRKIAKQALLGGDRTIGKKMNSLFREKGFSNIVETQVEFHSRNIGMENWKKVFWPILLSGLSETLSVEEEGLVRSAELWFKNAELDRKYNACFGIVEVSAD